jgi:phosphoribosylglycinamide formyltransferase-1
MRIGAPGQEGPGARHEELRGVHMVSFAVIASGSGTNFQALIDGVESGELGGVELKVLITNKPDAGAIGRAKKAGIPVEIALREKFKTREELDLEILRLLEKYRVDYVYLLGYMLLLKAPALFARYKDRIINLHPAILPSFPGLDAQKQAFDYGCKISGVTIHLVTPELDAGPILYQESADISGCGSGEEVHELLRPLEHECVKKVAHMLAHGKFVVEGRRARYIRG